MKLPIKVILFAALFLFMGFNADAQRRGESPPNPEDMAAKQTEQMTEKLNLNGDQAAKVKAINLSYAQKMQEARESSAGNRSAMQKITTAIEGEKAAEMKTVLTAGQYKTFEELQANQTNRRGKKSGGRRGGK